MIDNKIAMIFPPGLVFLGYVIGAGGLLGLVLMNPAAIVLLLLSVFMITSTKGIILDPEQKRFKEYQRIFWITIGNWTAMDPYPDLVILRKNLSSKAETYLTASKGTISESTVYDICLVDKSHRKKIEIDRVKGEEEAKTLAAEYGAKLEREVKPYSPVISARSRARRR